MIKEIKISGLKYQYFASDQSEIFRWTGSEMKRIKGWEEDCRYRSGKIYRRHCLIMKSGPRKKFYEHRLVLHAHVRPPKMGEVARHKTPDSLDNRLESLEWGSYYDNNVTDRKRDGTWPFQEEAKTEEDPIGPVLEEEDLPF